LTLTKCFPDKFTCDNGECLELSHRCNTAVDCADESDEYLCDYLVFGSNYAKELIPRREDALKDSAVVVHMNVSILAFPSIDTAALKFTTDFFLNLRW